MTPDWISHLSITLYFRSNTPRGGAVNCAQVRTLGEPFRSQRTQRAHPSPLEIGVLSISMSVAPHYPALYRIICYTPLPIIRTTNSKQQHSTTQISAKHFLPASETTGKVTPLFARTWPCVGEERRKMFSLAGRFFFAKPRGMKCLLVLVGVGCWCWREGV